MKDDNPHIIELADREYVNAVFDALLNYQVIEDLLKECIFASYGILAKTCPDNIHFSPSEREMERIRNNLGLGGLVAKFEEVTSNKNLCSKIKIISKTRNELAHSAAANYLKFPLSTDGAEKLRYKASEYREASETANKLYYELYEIYGKIMEVHGEKV